MAVSDLQVATLRAQLAGQTAEHMSLLAQLDKIDDGAGYSALVTAAFFEAVDRRFKGRSSKADVIEYVADVRSRFDEIAKMVDPNVAERLINKVLYGESTDDVDPQASARARLYLLAALTADAELSDVELDKFLEKARKMADYLLNGA